MTTSATKKQNQPEYEFGGPIGALGSIILLPFVVYGLYLFCNSEYCVGIDLIRLPELPPLSTFWSSSALLVIISWMAFQVALERILPGKIVHGVVLANGNKLPYNVNGFQAFVLTLVVAVVQHFAPAPFNFRLSYIYDNFLPLITATMLVALVLSVYLYVSSFVGKKLLAHGGNTGNFIYDFFIGRELNPRIGTFDFKEFCELRPGLIGWVLINAGMAVKQYENTGSISGSMLLVNIFQFIYVFDALYNEQSILTTMDIVTDGFGFMLAFGDLVWVPFTYSLQARFLVDYEPHLPAWGLAAIILLEIIGFYIFRGANSTKDTFRTDPNHPSVKHIKSIKTERGTSLMISGWWGMARHINYFGDWLMAWAWCLPTGFTSIIPYFYVIYFAVLLIHRDRRDDHNCSKKYGKDWDKYCSIVTSRIVPYIY